jgi:bifunctional UDP-N-acetylglucosamine pyrophosphorylase/glucosamine-1-phosphate N-acetyltransferase
MTVKIDIVILAAGRGSRMKSSLPKVMHPLAGKPLVQHVIETGQSIDAQCHLVIGHGGDQVKEYFIDWPVTFVEQREQLGTGHAVLQAMPAVREDSVVLVLYGDVPLIRSETLQLLLSKVSEHSIALLTAHMEDPTGYGRIVRDSSGQIQAIVEQKDASESQQKINEINTGILAVPASLLNQWLPDLGNQNAQGEYYLTDIIAMAVQAGIAVNACHPEHLQETAGINDRVQLAQLERWLQKHQAEQLMRNGVTLLDPDRIDIRGELIAEQDVVIDVNTVFIGDVKLESGVQVGPNCVIRQSTIGADTVIHANSVIDEATLGRECNVGPYARLRPGTELSDEAKVGNFVETKKARVGKGSKINHLSYVGDANLGNDVNIGAGTITCNYDGVNKHLTEIGDGVFVGSNSTLVAPVQLGESSFVGAGSVITKNTEPEKLTIGRSKQVTIANWKRPEKKK